MLKKRVKDYPIPVNDNEKIVYYDILIYKFNGGIALSGREVTDIPIKLSAKMSDVISKLYQTINRYGL